MLEQPGTLQRVASDRIVSVGSTLKVMVSGSALMAGVDAKNSIFDIFGVLERR